MLGDERHFTWYFQLIGNSFVQDLYHRWNKSSIDENMRMTNGQDNEWKKEWEMVGIKQFHHLQQQQIERCANKQCERTKKKINECFIFIRSRQFWRHKIVTNLWYNLDCWRICHLILACLLVLLSLMRF